MKNYISILVLFFGMAFYAGNLSAQCVNNNDLGVWDTNFAPFCPNTSFTLQNITPPVLDSGFEIWFVLHTGTVAVPQSTVYISSSPTFAAGNPAFNTPGLNCTVIITGLDGLGEFNWNDPCLIRGNPFPFSILNESFFTGITENLVLGCLNPTAGFTIRPQTAHPCIEITWNGTTSPLGTAFTIEVNQPGSYVYTISCSENNCSFTNTFLVQEDFSPFNLLTVVQPSCTGGGGNLISNNPSGDFIYSWSNGATSPSLFNLAPGTYCVTVTSTSTGCVSTDCYVLTQSSPLALAVELDTLSCNLFEPIVVVTGGSPPYTYQWSNNVPWNLQVPGPISFEVTVTDSGGCQETTLIEIDEQVCGIIAGKIQYNPINPCISDANEIPLPNVLVKTISSQNTWISQTDVSGLFRLAVDTGTYQIDLNLNPSIWDICTPISPAIISTLSDSIYYDVQLDALESCTDLKVNMISAASRRCFANNVYQISYANEGSITAEDATIEITLDPLLFINNASLPYTNLGGNVYRFEVGDIAPLEMGNFQFTYTLSCFSLLGQVICNSATIQSNQANCTNNLAAIEYSISSACQGDSIIYTVTNTGLVNGTAPFDYIVIEDGVMFMTGSGGPLSVGASITYSFEATGGSFRFEIVGNGNQSYSGLTVGINEGCTNMNMASVGFGNQLPLGDEENWLDQDCITVTGAYDPNDKQGFPVGYDQEQWIAQDQAIDFLVRFQNTGNDTAFTVVVRDTMDMNFDLSTFEILGASHAFKLEMEGPQAIAFVFDNIMLPDSNVSVPNSIGFIKYRVTPMLGLPLETVVQNQAAIYFDFNDPIFTNTTRHQLGKNFIVSGTSSLNYKFDVQLSPNPASDKISLQWNEEVWDVKEITLYNILGRQVAQKTHYRSGQMLDITHLPKGVYLVQLRADNGSIGTAKFIKE